MKKEKKAKNPISFSSVFLVFLLFYFLLSGVRLSGEDEQVKKEEEKKYSSSSSFSFLLTEGNTEDSTFSFDTDHKLHLKKDMLNLTVSIIRTKSQDQDNTEIYNTLFKYNRSLNSRIYLLGLFSFERNKSAGLFSRFTLSAGAGYALLKGKWGEISSEVSLGWTQENLRETGLDAQLQDGRFITSYLSSIFSTRLIYNISSSSQLVHQESIFFNLKEGKDYRINSLSSLVASISRYFALKSSIQFVYDHQPVAGFKSTDIFFLNSFVITF